MKKGVDYIAVGIGAFIHDGQGKYLMGLRTGKCRDEQYRWEQAGGGALEFNENANSGVQEDYCLTEISYGCVNDCYVEFDSLANIDNGSCVTSWKAAYISAVTNAQEVNVILQIDLVESWNIIGFTKPESIDAATAFDCILDELIVVKDNSGSIFLPSYSFNGIGNLIPGMGYQIKITDSISSFSFCD